MPSFGLKQASRQPQCVHWKVCLITMVYTVTFHRSWNIRLQDNAIQSNCITDWILLTDWLTQLTGLLATVYFWLVIAERHPDCTNKTVILTQLLCRLSCKRKHSFCYLSCKKL